VGYWGVGELAKLALVRSDVRAKVTKVRDRFEAETGESVYVIRGWVSLDSQAQTYADSLAQGFRAAPPDDSYHPKGAGVDLGIVGHVSDDAKTDQADPLYRRLAEIAVEEGLVAGYYYKTNTDKPDPYHFNADETLAVAETKWQAFLAEASKTGQGLGLFSVVILAGLTLWSLT
jgi:hypothetical protein